jgi:hypothetical protein
MDSTTQLQYLVSGNNQRLRQSWQSYGSSGLEERQGALGARLYGRANMTPRGQMLRSDGFDQLEACETLSLP